MKAKSFFKKALFCGIIMTTLFSVCTDVISQVQVYTSNTKISLAPGESVNYSIELSNKGNNTALCDVSVSGIPKSWDYSFKSGNYLVKQVAVKPNGNQSLKLKLDVPLKVNKGNYKFYIHAGDSQLPISVNVSRQGSYNTEFTCNQKNMEGHSKSNFSFKTTLQNGTDDTQLYSLTSRTPVGWSVEFKPNRKQATSVEVAAGGKSDINIDVKPPESVKAGNYKIPVRAVNSFTSADMELEVVITGTYGMELTTPNGLVSTDVTAGSKDQIELLVKNTGSVALKNVKLTGSNPKGWKVSFDKKEINDIEPGKVVKTYATIEASDDAVAGDYITNITAKVPEVTSKLSFRVGVKTPLIWGWIGVFVIVAALGSVVMLFRKYGRR